MVRHELCSLLDTVFGSVLRLLLDFVFYFVIYDIAYALIYIFVVAVIIERGHITPPLCSLFPRLSGS